MFETAVELSLAHFAVQAEPPTLSTRACDACAVRKTKCDRRSPCRRCEALGLSCRITREHSKPGPKGPWAKKKRAAGRPQRVPLKTRATDVHTINIPDTASASPTSKVKKDKTVDTIQKCLYIYSQEYYPLWPVVDANDLSSRLENKADVSAYTLAAALSAVVLERSQLGIFSEEVASIQLGSEELAEESENARKQIIYQEIPSTDVLLSCFFLHIHSANSGRITKASLLLREAISFAQLLELDRAEHYTTLTDSEAQLDLRIFWLLYITERGHTTRFDFPRVLPLDPDLPALQAERNPSGFLPFISMCQLFQTFSYAMDHWESVRIYDSLAHIDAHLQEAHESLFNTPSSQRTDFLMTQQWMRVILWKRAMFHVRLSINAAQGCLSFAFPEQIARNVVAYIKSFPRATVESHGLGMQMKLADIAISFADVISCTPSTPQSRQLMQVGSTETLHFLAEFLLSIPNRVNPRLELLEQKMYGMDWNFTLEHIHDGFEDVADEASTQTRELRQITSS